MSKSADQISKSQTPASLEMRRFLAKLRKDVVPVLDPKPHSDDIAAAHALTALVLTTAGGMPPDDTPFFVVDGNQDYGIDGLYFNSVTRILYIVQSKLFQKTDRTIQQSDVLKLLRGTDRVLNGDLAKANDKLRDAYDVVFEAIDDINTKIILLIASTSRSDPEPNVREDLDTFCADRNLSDEILSWRHVGFNELFQAAKLYSPAVKTDVDIQISSLGHISDPYHSFFGGVSGAQIAGWVQQFGAKLFDQNVRATLPRSTVNEEILETLRSEPRRFWYLNNGITAIAASARSTPFEGDTKKIVAESMSIVNGAQTAGMLARAANEGVDLSEVIVQFRVISLANAEAGLDDRITRATNTQNPLNALDFVSLDTQQGIIHDELAQMGYTYAYKRGGESKEGNTLIEVRDAAIALACAQPSLGLTVQAKRYVSGLWSDINTTPYTTLFNSKTTGAVVLDAWSVLKTCEAVNRKLRQNAGPDDKATLVHAEKFLTHCVIESLRARGIDFRDSTRVEAVANEIASRITRVYGDWAGKVVPAADFKNVGKLEAFKAEVQRVS